MIINCSTLSKVFDGLTHYSHIYRYDASYLKSHHEVYFRYIAVCIVVSTLHEDYFAGLYYAY